MNNQREFVPNNLVWAILTTLLCCLPLGIVSIVYAAKVDGLVASGNLPAAQAAATSAKNWAIAAAVVGPALLLVYFFLIAGVGALGALGN